jgi:hypothetical protein
MSAAAADQIMSRKLGGQRPDQGRGKGGVAMTKLFLLAVVLLCAATLLQSQDVQITSTGSGQRTIAGCLDGADGNYTLTDRYGRTYQLGNETSAPAAYVGREVQVTTSTPAAVALANSVGGAEAAAEQPLLTVEAVKSLSGTCRSGR